MRWSPRARPRPRGTDTDKLTPGGPAIAAPVALAGLPCPAFRLPSWQPFLRPTRAQTFISKRTCQTVKLRPVLSLVTMRPGVIDRLPLP